jgi:hypothetical protein
MLQIDSDVRIPTPQKYALRLAKHFEHRVTVQRDQPPYRVEFPDAPCEIGFTDDVLHLHIQATSPESLARIREVVTRHLKQVASQEAFDIEWSGDLPAETVTPAGQTT